ncbi:branched-chain amino acid transporter permease [Campylobacter vulpis]|uniref:Branched-chain amino acid ABC transporter n=1 Tax=Campylobacter vulpis TaxID=1655500 RepID=A0A2G4R0S1_9BACT|nr:AzlD domain-containing protein [Campylobacter vulpis]MBS4236067.1 AzlD domain-containing protein [Campylobacter vulpis]MBS4269148.1 AzlD domain-containing protein [Campylobacter vulpis]MBS4281773.1 AzlD domain-containing protein [Campylobacter vulpis]MBS4306786.1 AzlD domain-containing protein [Campylobacter vulpis]MBS4313875.1 AzlD domain-containing protein [Campylobacter vulpis]
MFEKYILMMIFAAFLGTYLSRVLPYVFFKHKKESQNLLFIQKNMPLLIIIVLFFYTFYGVDFTHSPYGLDMILACVFVFLFHLKFKNALLSIILGTIFYMICLRL